MRRKLVVGNWKMNGSQSQVEALLGALIAAQITSLPLDIGVCPPYVYLPQAAQLLRQSSIALGAQDVSGQAEGAYTGEISAQMLVDFSCRYVIVGHSERRAHWQESDELVTRKFMAAQRAGLIPILCVGESLAEREANSTLAVVQRQLMSVLQLTGADAFRQAVVAYEPVWAIGTGRAASVTQAEEVHAALRKMVATHDAGIASQLRLLYGGSVTPANARELFSAANIDGALVGGASLKAEAFCDICRGACE